jgi:hypothetical protein
MPPRLRRTSSSEIAAKTKAILRRPRHRNLSARTVRTPTSFYGSSPQSAGCLGCNILAFWRRHYATQLPSRCVVAPIENHGPVRVKSADHFSNLTLAPYLSNWVAAQAMRPANSVHLVRIGEKAKRHSMTLPAYRHRAKEVDRARPRLSAGRVRTHGSRGHVAALFRARSRMPRRAACGGRSRATGKRENGRDVSGSAPSWTARWHPFALTSRQRRLFRRSDRKDVLLENDVGGENKTVGVGWMTRWPSVV